MIENAYAQAGDVAASGSGFASLVPFLLIVAIFYFLIIRPQQKQQKRHRQMVSEAKRGDKVVTASGIHGTISAIDDKIMMLQVADNLEVKMDRNFIQAIEGYQAENQKKSA